MRTFRLLSVAVLSVLVGSAALVYSQDEKQQEEKPALQVEPKSKQDEAKPPRQDEAKPPKQDRQMEKHEQKRGQEQSGEHPKTQGDHGRHAGKGGHIPDDKFRAHFGQSHHFTAKTVIVQGQPRFQYSGFTFELVEVWPIDWAFTDDCYIDYLDGDYYLIDLFHPGVRILLIVVM